MTQTASIRVLLNSGAVYLADLYEYFHIRYFLWAFFFAACLFWISCAMICGFWNRMPCAKYYLPHFASYDLVADDAKPAINPKYYYDVAGYGPLSEIDAPDILKLFASEYGVTPEQLLATYCEVDARVLMRNTIEYAHILRPRLSRQLEGWALMAPMDVAYIRDKNPIERVAGLRIGHIRAFARSADAYNRLVYTMYHRDTAMSGYILSRGTRIPMVVPFMNYVAYEFPTQYIEPHMGLSPYIRIERMTDGNMDLFQTALETIRDKCVLYMTPSLSCIRGMMLSGLLCVYTVVNIHDTLGTIMAVYVFKRVGTSIHMILSYNNAMKSVEFADVGIICASMAKHGGEKEPIATTLRVYDMAHNSYCISQMLRYFLPSRKNIQQYLYGIGIKRLKRATPRNSWIFI